MSRQQATNRELGQDTARANLLTNGGFEIWQRGVGPFTSNYGPDRWFLNPGGGSTVSVSRVAGYWGTNTYAAQIVYTHSAQSFFFQKVINTADFADLRFKTLSFSARVYSSAANAVQIQLLDSGGVLGTSTMHPGGSTWVQLTTTGTVSNLSAGGELHARVVLSASATVMLDDAMLAMGSVPADYAPPHPAEDLLRCQRYYEVLGGVTNGYPSVLGYNAAITSTMALSWKVTKAVTPTVTKVGTWAVINCGQPAFDRNTVQGCRMYTSGLAAGPYETYPADATNYLAVEANP